MLCTAAGQAKEKHQATLPTANSSDPSAASRLALLGVADRTFHSSQSPVPMAGTSAWETAESVPFIERIECQGCGRHFKPESYATHSKICAKVCVWHLAVPLPCSWLCAPHVISHLLTQTRFNIASSSCASFSSIHLLTIQQDSGLKWQKVIDARPIP